MTVFWTAVLIYFIGVIISLVIIAWDNAKNSPDEISIEICFFSWPLIALYLFFALCDLISKLIRYPYEWLYNIFRKKYGKRK